MDIQTAFATYTARITEVIDPLGRIYWMYLFSALLLAILAYYIVERSERLEAEAEGEDYVSRQSVFGYIFDPKVWLHPSSLQDMRYFLINAFVYYVLIAQLLIGSHHFAGVFHAGLVGSFGEFSQPWLSGWPAIAAYTLVSVILFDFGVWFAHWLFHRVPFLWHFHAVHHSAEQLNPMTLFRMHPVDLFITGTIATFGQAIAYAMFFWLTAETPKVAQIAGLNIVIFLFYVGGYNLRHSHIWLNYPVWLSKIFISPAQHQIHHSSDPKHFDHNMGLIFSFWDQLFGTHYIPREREKLKFGLSRKNPNPFGSVWEMYATPFRQAARTLKAKSGGETMPNRTRALLLAALAGLGLAWAAQVRASADDATRIELERMTWTEVHRAIVAGSRTVIVPIGGTEQNGPFQSLGKHNTVVAHTARRIAAEVGGTLVAPVMAYVPEGRITPPEGHMTYAGTISVPEPVFEQVLEATAKSLRQHGFTTIAFVGDSGSTQTAQEAVVERLSTKWANVRVVSLSSYYAANGQTEWLLAQGHSREAIGYHSGMRDMSEVLALRSDDVRRRKDLVIEGMDPGNSGDFRLATAEIGEKMLALKVAAGVKQLRAVAAVGGNS